jgi:hypothetical protein
MSSESEIGTDALALTIAEVLTDEHENLNEKKEKDEFFVIKNKKIAKPREKYSANQIHSPESGSDLSDSYSDSDSESDSDTDIKGGFYKKVNYKQVEDKINLYYFDINHTYSSALDILASYLKGHKFIYLEAKFYTEQQLNWLMMPSEFK